MIVAGCATVEDGVVLNRIPERGVYHKVREGETLWKIAKIYNTDLDAIVRSNNIPNVAQIEKNQLIFIPGADKVVELPAGKDDLKKNEFSWPVQGKVLFYFNQAKQSYLKDGIGIQAAEGEMVLASREGRVIFSDYLSGYAYTVIIDHADGFCSVYSQNSNLLVSLNQYVLKGTPIAQIGKNGDLAFLHFEIRKNALPNNPLHYLP